MQHDNPPAAHIDGSPCPEGEQRLPAAGALCCAAFTARTYACYFDIRYEYWASQQNWFIVIQPDAGGGGIAISHCPHCGTKLQGDGLEGRYMDMEGLD